MNWENYRQWTHTTAVYPEAYAKDYLAMGLLGEIGEFANKLKKVYRDDAGTVTPERWEMLVDELGDICWYVSEISNMNSKEVAPSDPSTTMRDAAEWLVEMVEEWVYFAAGTAGERRMVLALASLADRLNTTLEYVLDRNQQKLMRRNSEGTLHGDGDQR